MEFLTLFTQWIDAQIQFYEDAIAKRRADYLKKKWKWSEDAVSEFNARLTELREMRDTLVAEFTRCRPHGNNLLILANIVFNEAGAYNQASKVAVAYAWLNRTGGNTREPTGAEISEYLPLRERWDALNDGQRLTFLRNFGGSMRAARQRLNDHTPMENDPTEGATHWVSPLGLPMFRNQRGRYARTVDTARNRAFPTWARSTADPEVARMQKRGQLGPRYAEITVAGVNRAQFLFYADVR